MDEGMSKLPTRTGDEEHSKGGNDGKSGESTFKVYRPQLSEKEIRAQEVEEAERILKGLDLSDGVEKALKRSISRENAPEVEFSPVASLGINVANNPLPNEPPGLDSKDTDVKKGPVSGNIGIGYELGVKDKGPFIRAEGYYEGGLYHDIGVSVRTGWKYDLPQSNTSITFGGSGEVGMVHFRPGTTPLHGPNRPTIGVFAGIELKGGTKVEFSVGKGAASRTYWLGESLYDVSQPQLSSGVSVTIPIDSQTKANN